MSISQQEFRRALGYFATGVTVITVARGEGQVHGMTVNAFTSASLVPPLVLVCIDHASRTRPLLQAKKRFGVSVLREEQEAVACYYADASEDHETPVHLGVRYAYTERGTPLLEPCLAQLECVVVAAHDAGDHTLFVGEVQQVKVAHGRPLVFYRGQFPKLEADGPQDLEKGRGAMRFGIYTEIQTPPGKAYYDMIWEIVRQIEHADAVGFDVYSAIDHHFFQKFSISANPLAMFAAAAQRTRRIRFRTALHTLPLENPMRLAGQIAEVDILTHGRLECGLGRGHAWMFGPANVPLEESRPRYDEAIEILIRAWTQDKVSFEGQYYKVKDVTVVPKPIQKPHPRLFTGGTSDITYQMAGERGWGIFVPPLLPWTVLEGPLGIYKKACAARGHQPDIVYIRPVYLDEDEKQIRKEVEQALLNFLAFNASPIESLQGEEKKAELRAKGYGFYASGALEALTKLTYEEIVEQQIGFIGTPPKVIRQVENLLAKGGIGELAIVANFGGLEHWKSIKTQDLFAKQVMPAFR